MPIRACVVCAAVGVVMNVAGQPQVPGGFTARLIQQTPGSVVPKLSAVQSSKFGEGVITASTSSGVTTFQLLEPTGIVLSLGTFVDPDIDFVQRVRFDDQDVLPDQLHASLVILGSNGSFGPPFGDTTVYVTANQKGSLTERLRTGTSSEERAYDFVLTAGAANNPSGAVLLDADAENGTSLATLDPVFAFTEQTNNSVPANRSDTDVAGFAVDRTGNYGGGILVADTDENSDELSAIYELRDVSTGGSYRPIAGPVSSNTRQYGDLDIAASGSFGGIIYVTETLTNEIQQVAPDGTHTTWATGFVGIDSLSISPDGESMYVADLNGVWLIRPAGNEPGPAIVATDPSVPAGSTITGNAVDALRVIFTEPVSFTDADVTITNTAGQPVAFDASGSGTQFMIIGLAAPLSSDDYTVNLAETITSVATAQPLDGDNDGIAGGDASLTFTHRCPADQNFDGQVSPADFNAWIINFNTGCP